MPLEGLLAHLHGILGRGCVGRQANHVKPLGDLGYSVKPLPHAGGLPRSSGEREVREGRLRECTVPVPSGQQRRVDPLLPQDYRTAVRPMAAVTIVGSSFRAQPGNGWRRQRRWEPTPRSSFLIGCLCRGRRAARPLMWPGSGNLSFQVIEAEPCDCPACDSRCKG
jgi:hypothetical protein